MGPSHLRAAAVALCCALSAFTTATADEPLSVTYLGNAGVLVEQGDTKLLFDPLFRLQNTFYRAVPDHLENALMSGEPPFDGVDAVLITHFHLDHFSPNLVLNYLVLNPSVQLYAPQQAVEGLQQFSAGQEKAFLERVTGLSLSQFGNPFSQRNGELQVEILRIPHNGWPDGSRDVQNLVYRVTLGDGSSVLHLGDAAAQTELFQPFSDHWAARENRLVLAPYWFQQDPQGLTILNDILKAGTVFNVHVPSDVAENPSTRPKEYQGQDLLLKPGTKRRLAAKNPTTKP